MPNVRRQAEQLKNVEKIEQIIFITTAVYLHCD